MKRFHFVGLAVMLLAALSLLFASPVQGGGDKVVICHFPPDNPWNAHTIQVSKHALAAHYAHGDIPGPCPVDATGQLACLVQNTWGPVFAFYDVPERQFDPLRVYTTMKHSLPDDPVFGALPARLSYWTAGSYWTQLFGFDPPPYEMQLPPNVTWGTYTANCRFCLLPIWHLIVQNARGQKALIEAPANPPGYDTSRDYYSVSYTQADGACEDYPAGLLFHYTGEYWELDGSPVVEDSNHDGHLGN